MGSIWMPVDIWLSVGGKDQCWQPIAVALLTGGADHHRGQRDAVGMIRNVNDITDNTGDVVWCAIFQCGLDHGCDRRRRVAHCHEFGDVRFIDIAGQPVAAQQIAITEPGLTYGDVGLGRMNAVDCSHQ